MANIRKNTWDQQLWQKLAQALPDYEWIMRGRVMVGMPHASEGARIELRNLHSSGRASIEIEALLFKDHRLLNRFNGESTTMTAPELAIRTAKMLLAKQGGGQ